MILFKTLASLAGLHVCHATELICMTLSLFLWIRYNEVPPEGNKPGITQTCYNEV
jgi:hypothetical protein